MYDYIIASDESASKGEQDDVEEEPATVEVEADSEGCKSSYGHIETLPHLAILLHP